MMMERWFKDLQSDRVGLEITIDNSFISESLDSIETLEWEINSGDGITTFSQLEYSWDGNFGCR